MAHFIFKHNFSHLPLLRDVDDVEVQAGQAVAELGPDEPAPVLGQLEDLLALGRAPGIGARSGHKQEALPVLELKGAHKVDAGVDLPLEVVLRRKDGGQVGLGLHPLQVQGRDLAWEKKMRKET